MPRKRTRIRALLTRGPQATVLPRRMAALREMPITRALKECDCRAKHAFHEWRSQTLTPAFNYGINFTIPANRRLVIELVTASISVPIGELARLRMFTGLGQSPSNLDFVLTPQGIWPTESRGHPLRACLRRQPAGVQHQQGQRAHHRLRTHLCLRLPGAAVGSAQQIALGISRDSTILPQEPWQSPCDILRVVCPS